MMAGAGWSAGRAARRGALALAGLAWLVAAGLSAPCRVDAAETAKPKADAASSDAAGTNEASKEAAPAKAKPSAANTFNRLLKKPRGPANAKPAEDGIHDPANPGTALLQWPAEAFEGLPKSGDGNRIDWVKALERGHIAPLVDYTDPNAEPFTLDLVIVREVKGSMPDVVFPHQQHTEWLDCTNCHDEIFEPQKGANQISMAAILLGQKCGVCHGKVAFPVTDCRRCHAQPKSTEQLKALSGKISTDGSSAPPDVTTSNKDAKNAGDAKAGSADRSDTK